MRKRITVALLMLTACGSPTAPVLDGSYELVGISGDPLPAVVVDTPGGWTVIALSGRLTITADRYTIGTTVRREVADSSYVVDEIGEGRVRTRSDGTITLVPDQGFGLSLLIVTSEGVETVGQFTSGIHTYRRVMPGQ